MVLDRKQTCTMKFIDWQFTPKKRRGLSSVVGALLFVVLMVATFSVLGLALNTQTDIVSTGRDVAATDLKKQQEDFIIGVTSNPFPLLEVAVNNQGQNPVEIFTMVITNKTNAAAGYPTTVYDIPSDTSFIASGDSSNILSTTPLTLAANNTYGIKVISSLGTIKKVDLVCGSSSCGFVGVSGLFADLFMDPPIGIPTKNVTVAMLVTNTGNEQLTNVQPVETNPTIELPGTSSLLAGPTFDSFSPITLGPHQSTLFRWDLQVDGEIGDVWNFTNRASAEDGVGTIFTANSTDQMILIDPNDCGGCGPGGPGGGGGEGGETIILIDDLLIKPSLFLTIPSPFGSVASPNSADDHLGVWGVQVANPLNFTIGISKVTITAFAPGANSNLRIFDKNADSQNISPYYTGIPLDLASWYVGDENVLVWKNFTDPIVLNPYQSDSFMLKMNPFSNSVDLEAVIVQTSIFSTAGSFGKAAYQTTMFPAGGASDAPIANVYLSKAVDSTNNADIYGHINGITNGTSQEFIVVMADLDENNQSFIASGSEFIINVPREWGLPVIDLAKTTKIITNATEPQIIAHTDGSHQIIALLEEDIGDVSAHETATLTFSSQAPEKEVERLYIMYVLGNGITNTGIHTVGPLSEIVLHVIGNVTGYP